MESGADIYIDLEDLGPSLSATQRRALLKEIQTNLRTCEDQRLGIQVVPVQSGDAQSKSGDIVVLGGILLALTATAGYSFDLDKATRLLRAVWKPLAKLLSKDTKVQIKSGGKSLTLSTSDGDAAAGLLELGAEIAIRFGEKPTKRPTGRKRVATITPQKR
jgi:hypothetical protein